MGARFDAVKQRAVVLKAVLRRPLAIYIAAAWTVFSTLATLRDNFLPEKLRGALQVLKLIPKLPWWVWSLGVLAILLVSVIEGAYQEIKRRDLVIEQRAPLPGPGFAGLIHVTADDQRSDMHLRLVNSSEKDWFTVEVMDVRPRVEWDHVQFPWPVRWGDITEPKRHIPKNTPATLLLCRAEQTETAGKAAKAVRVRFFTPGEDRIAHLSLADAWTAQDIFVGYDHIAVEVDLRVTATETNQTTGRRIGMTFTHDLQLRVQRIDVT